MNNKGAILSGACTLVAFMVVVTMMYNDWKVDSVRPDINKSQNMIVHPETAPNEFNIVRSNVPMGSGSASMGGEDMGGEDGETVGEFAKAKATMVSHSDYVKYLKANLSSKIDTIYNSMPESSKQNIYIRVMYRGHEKIEDGGASVVKQAGTAYDQSWGSARTVGGTEIGEFALKYALDFVDNETAATQREDSVISAMRRLPRTATWLAVSAQDNPGVPSNVLKMWGAYSGVLNGGTMASSYINSVSSRTISSLAKYVPDIELKVATSVDNFAVIKVNNTPTAVGNSYVHQMDRASLDALFTSYNQYPMRDASQRLISYNSSKLLAKCIDSGYSKFMVVVGVSPDTTLNEVVGDAYYNLQVAVTGCLRDTNFGNSVFENALLVQAGEAAIG